jgi:hypothetical protein
MKNNPLPRLDQQPDLRELLLPHCRLALGEIWADPVSGHKIGCFDAANSQEVSKLMEGDRASLAIHDPPYNLVALQEGGVGEFIEWCKQWVKNTLDWMASDASFYVWLGADQRNGFQPLPDFMMMMRGFDIKTRSFITMRNQRGYGTQKTGWLSDRSCFTTQKEIQFLMWRLNTRTFPKFFAAITKKLMASLLTTLNAASRKIFVRETCGLIFSKFFIAWPKMSAAATHKSR